MSKDALVATRFLNDDDDDQHICRKAQDKLKAANIGSCVRTSEIRKCWRMVRAGNLDEMRCLSMPALIFSSN